jgi:rhodanese-related sulfurtransferase
MNPFKFIGSLLKSVPRVSAPDCIERLHSGAAVLVDVREPAEWARGVVSGASLLPLSDLTGNRTQWQPFLTANAQREIALYCAAGGRAGIAARILIAEGFLASNAGGIDEWTAAGWPIVASKTAI